MTAQLPPERVITSTLLLLPANFPNKGPVCRRGLQQLEAQREALQRLKAAKWITLTPSAFAALSSIVGMKDDGTTGRNNAWL